VFGNTLIKLILFDVEKSILVNGEVERIVSLLCEFSIYNWF